MGKRQNLGGLARFVQDAFKAKPSSSFSHLQHETDSNESAADAAAVVEQVTFASSSGTARTASQVEDEEAEEGQESQNAVKRPTKKRKVGLLGPGYEKYDATGLVPHYTNMKQVPEKLRKCEFYPL